jgi:predicted nucleic acid-binding protein
LSVYADSSFVVSLYVPDSNSDEALVQMTGLSTPLWLSTLGEIEIVNAFQLDLFRKEILSAELRNVLSSFRADVDSGVFSIRPMSALMYDESRRLSATWSATLGTRSLDILQVASALVLKAETFLTFDARQKKLAKAAGLICR